MSDSIKTSDKFSPLALGCATFGWGMYAEPPSTDEEKMMPLRTVRLALRSGITVFDTAPQSVDHYPIPLVSVVPEAETIRQIPFDNSYHPSEGILGNALDALKEEYPRSSYRISSKCGRYNSDGFDYSPSNIEASVRRSLRLLKCGYLDIVCESLN